MKIAIIGDAHLDKKLYENNPKAKGVVFNAGREVFAAAVDLAREEGTHLLCFPGDLLNHYTISNDTMQWLIGVILGSGMDWIISGGNHDVTRMYSSVCALDVLAALPRVDVVNSFKAEIIDYRGVKICCIPHMRNQAAFQDAVELIPAGNAITLCHGSPGDMSFRQAPNDLYMPDDLLDILEQTARVVFIGHEHVPKRIRQNVYQCGSTMPFSFSEVGVHNMYFVETADWAVERATLPHLKFHDFDVKWEGAGALIHEVGAIVNRYEGIFRINISCVSADEESIVKTLCASLDQEHETIILFRVSADDSPSLDSVTYTELTFQLRNELGLYAEEAELKTDQYNRLDGYLVESQKAGEEEEEDA